MGRSADPELARYVAARIVAQLRDRGHDAYFAGGCVRDELLGLHPTDYDIATDATPGRVRELFTRTNEVGAAFGVMLVADDGSLSHGFGGQGRADPASSAVVVVEVATFRADGTYSDARRPDSVRFSDAPADAARRDFTINALFLDPLAPADAHPKHAHEASGLLPREVRGRIIDFVGGQEDLRRRVIRAVGDADQRLKEDHLRALRAVRFSARLGFEIEPGTRSAISRHAAELRGVSRERIGEELRRMMAHGSRAQAAWLLERLGLDAPVLGELAREAGSGDAGPETTVPMLWGLGSGVEGCPKEWPADWPAWTSAPEFGAALAAWALDRRGGLVGVVGTAVGAIEGRAKDVAASIRRALCLSNEETRQLSDVLVGVHTLVLRFDGMSVSAKKRFASGWSFGPSVRVLAGVDAARTSRILLQYRDLRDDGVGVSPTPLMTGDELVAAGLVPGPRFKGVLDQVYDAQLEGKVRSKAEALELARRLCV
ncbi:MAG: CCA tRNA nucleotidyltransferase [Phycisphaeraceae bacterium]|nr:CCA tRNA nucleotidyltransferase [Phycisphaeraceae bacterium]